MSNTDLLLVFASGLMFWAGMYLQYILSRKHIEYVKETFYQLGRKHGYEQAELKFWMSAVQEEVQA